MLNVSRAIWNQTQQKLDQITDKAAAIEFCKKGQTAFRQRSEDFWSRTGDLPGWTVLDRMAQVILGADAALAELPAMNTPAALINQYTGAWWRVDRAYRQFRAELDQGLASLDSALKWTRRIYREFLSTINDRFVGLVEQAGNWPPEVIPQDANPILSSGPGKKGTILVEALRFELGQELAAGLRFGPKPTVKSSLCPLPSITPLGMAAHLPGWTDFRVDYDNKWIITAPGFTGNLAEKKDRLAWLESQLGGVATYDLDAWLTTRFNQIIDKVKVRPVETEYKYWAELTNMGIKNVNISDGVARQYDKLLAGGIWAILQLRYDASFQHRGQTRPFIIKNLKPIQQRHQRSARCPRQLYPE